MPAEAFWICLPLALAVAAGGPSGRVAALSGAGLLAAAVLIAGPPPLVVASGLLSLAVLVTVRLRLERERDAMSEFARRDPLTGLANRRALDERLRHEIARHLRQGQRFTVLALDLDGFKAVNDRFGHDAGDELLRDVATALRGAVREQDAVGRLGGDEFCIVAPDTGKAGAARLTDRILASLAGLTAGVSRVSASAGAAVFPDDARDPAALLAAADAAALAAKRRRYAERRRAA